MSLIYPRVPGSRELEKFSELDKRSLSLQEFVQRWELSQRQLADILGVPRSTINRWLSYGVPFSSRRLLFFYLYHLDIFWRS